MGTRYYTLLLIPQKKGTIRKLRVSSTLFTGIIILCVVSLLALVFLANEYINTRDKLCELDDLREISATQREQISVLADKVGDFQKKMEELRQFDKKLRIMTNLEEPHSSNDFLGVGGSVREDYFSESPAARMDDELIEKIHESMDDLLDEATVQQDSFRELHQFLEEQKSVLAGIPSIWPVIGWVTSEYGYRISPFTGNREFHKGIDIATRIGEEVVSPADGKVKKITYETDMGNMIIIDHGSGISTCYGHLLKKSTAGVGQKVKRGDIIGYVGNSGRSTGPHLHYGVRVDGVFVNPRKYLF
ncbi:MAG: peptidoglycan DD-metalloendopeptidase family protein [Deltaproteobacteria bacterium]|nr:peptidoglycan DD-metalloendopeptidase family protein [Deltaproteobacteria bacterium]